jgi:hypothetical protein
MWVVVMSHISKSFVQNESSLQKPILSLQSRVTLSHSCQL